MQGLIECEACNKGRYQPSSSQSSCDDCPMGWMQPRNNQPDCLECNKGKFTSKPSMYNCKSCEAGQFQSEKKQDSCIECPSYYYQNKMDATNCKKCKYGQYTVNETRSRACVFIPVNMNVEPPLLRSLVSIDHDVSDAVLLYSINHEILFDEEVEALLVQISTQPNLADQKNAQLHPDWKEIKLVNFRQQILRDGDTDIKTISDENYPKELVPTFVFKQTLRIHNDNGPIWRHPVFLRAAYQFEDGGTSKWTLENQPLPISSDCQESEGIQYYLRTTPNDNVCSQPFDLLGINQTFNSNSSTETVKCVPCPQGASCNSPGDILSEEERIGVGMMLWNIAPRQGWWRIPWAPLHGDMKNDDGQLIKSPQWFHRCPHAEACIGVNPTDTFGSKGWSSEIGRSHRSNWTSCGNMTSLDGEIVLGPPSKCLNGTEGVLCALCSNGFIRINGVCTKCYEKETRMWTSICAISVACILIMWLRKFLKRLKSNAINAVRDVNRMLIGKGNFFCVSFCCSIKPVLDQTV